jgi:hypothetical protein|tara:strand:+ start:331 stop:558 length:228 start_codon:yes stop_codon:yes gene_type:complete
MNRPLYTIAKDIRSNWTNVNYAAEPYLEAMEELNSMKDRYVYDTAESVVLYFLANASAFRGADARRIKLELKAML